MNTQNQTLWKQDAHPRIDLPREVGGFRCPSTIPYWWWLIFLRKTTILPAPRWKEGFFLVLLGEVRRMLLLQANDGKPGLPSQYLVKKLLPLAVAPSLPKLLRVLGPPPPGGPDLKGSRQKAACLPACLEGHTHTASRQRAFLSCLVCSPLASLLVSLGLVPPPFFRPVVVLVLAHLPSPWLLVQRVWWPRTAVLSLYSSAAFAEMKPLCLLSPSSPPERMHCESHGGLFVVVVALVVPPLPLPPLLPWTFIDLSRSGRPRRNSGWA